MKEKDKIEDVKQEEVVEKVEKKEAGSDKSQKSNGLALIVVLLIIIACLGGVIYYLGNGKDDDSNTEKDNKKQESKVSSPELKSEYRLGGNGLENFDIHFLQIENKEENKVYSPLSIKYALEMLAEGADGDSKAQLDAIIGDYVAKKYTNSKNMSFANAFFVKNSFRDSIKNDYVDLLKDKYSAEVVYDDFKNASLINKWIKDKTLGMIPSLVDDVSNNDFFLVNALAIDMEWVNKIQAHGDNAKTYSVDFLHEQVKITKDMSKYGTEYNSSGESVQPLELVGYTPVEFDNSSKKAKSVEVMAIANKYDAVKTLGEDNIRTTIKKEYTDWMNSKEGKECREFSSKEDYPDDSNKFVDKFIKELDSNYKHVSGSTDFLFYDDDDVKVFAKDLKEYDGITLQYVGIMPKEEKLANFVNSINTSKLNAYINSLKDISLNSFEEGYMTIVNGFIPMFKMEYELDLIGDLNKMGVTDIFDSKKANLSKMTSEKEYIDPALHKANIEFSNEGIKAAAAVAVGGAGSTGCGFEHDYDVPLKFINVTVNKPYMYLVRDKNSGEVWFTGTVYQPVEFDPSEN